jgi:hypothetical protein
MEELEDEKYESRLPPSIYVIIKICVLHTSAEQMIYEMKTVLFCSDVIPVSADNICKAAKFACLSDFSEDVQIFTAPLHSAPLREWPFTGTHCVRCRSSPRPSRS